MMASELQFLHTLANKEKSDSLIIVPSASTSPLSLMLLARSFSSRKVCSFSFAGMEDNQEPHREITEMAEAYVRELRTVQPEGPYRIAGYCFGGIVAQAMAAHLEALGQTVERLVLIEIYLPPLAADGTVDQVDKQLQTTFQSIWQKSQEDYSRLPAALSQRFEKIFKLHVEATTRYRIEPVNAEIQLIRTTCHPERLYQRWAQLSTTKFTETIIPGDTFSILKHPDVRTLAQTIEQALKRSSLADRTKRAFILLKMWRWVRASPRSC
jgi:thioesterase domain-containing protein